MFLKTQENKIDAVQAVSMTYFQFARGPGLINTRVYLPVYLFAI